jgi:hypothetical protein
MVKENLSSCSVKQQAAVAIRETGDMDSHKMELSGQLYPSSTLGKQSGVPVSVLKACHRGQFELV